MTMVHIQNGESVSRQRRRHKKSKTGCMECKRRRIKCDETKPSCTQCVLGLYKCKYLSAPRLSGEDQVYKIHVASITTGESSPCSNTSLHVNRSPSFGLLPCLASASVETDCGSNDSNTPKSLSDIALYNHYLQETSHALSLCQNDYNALHINMPTLAQRNEMVFQSLLAVSAASLAWTMMSKEPSISTDTVDQVLLTGYQHYNLASERMRKAISGPEVLEQEALIASALILVPFATASQQINNWISRKGGTRDLHKLLPSTPRDVIVIMRGIRTMLQSIDCAESSTNFASISKQGDIIDKSLGLPAISTAFKDPAPSRNHVMTAMVVTTSQRAFSKLRQRLDAALFPLNMRFNNLLLACKDAFDILEQIRSGAFSDINSLPSPSLHMPTIDSPKSGSTASSRIAPWLRSFAGQFFLGESSTPRPNEALTRFFLSFLIQVPQEFLDLVLPLLDQRLENPVADPLDCIPVDLTHQQALALDIYAHWSVLMFLVEKEAWWIGSLPKATLAGMVNRYGDRFVSRLWPEDGHGKGQWWPGSMLDILREIKRYE